MKWGEEMELRQLKYFLAVADARSIVSAANSLYISRQAVSKAIAQLETELNVELFMRDSNGAFLTPAGVMFYDRIRSNVMELEEVRQEMQRYGSRYQQRVRLAFSIGTMQLYETALNVFREEQENIELEYHEYPEEQCAALLLEHQADIALCLTAPKDAAFAALPVTSSPFGVLMRRTEALSEQVEFSDLQWLPLAGVNDGQTTEFCKKHNLGLQYTGYDRYRLYSLTAAGKCAMLLPQILAPVGWSDLVWIPIAGAEDWTVYRLTMQSQEHNILYHTVLDNLQMQVFAQPRREGGV